MGPVNAWGAPSGPPVDNDEDLRYIGPGNGGGMNEIRGSHGPPVHPSKSGDEDLRRMDGGGYPPAERNRENFGWGNNYNQRGDNFDRNWDDRDGMDEDYAGGGGGGGRQQHYQNFPPHYQQQQSHHQQQHHHSNHHRGWNQDGMGEHRGRPGGFRGGRRGRRGGGGGYNNY